jgi:hypothetical protein
MLEIFIFRSALNGNYLVIFDCSSYPSQLPSFVVTFQWVHTTVRFPGVKPSVSLTLTYTCSVEMLKTQWLCSRRRLIVLLIPDLGILCVFLYFYFPMGRTAVPFHICFFMIAGINFLVKLMA